MARANARGTTRPFAPFEWLLAGRYLVPRLEGFFISVIAAFSFIGILLGVATLIVVMSVMNGFREDLFAKILGLNGHVIAHKIGHPFTDYEDLAARIRNVEGVSAALPLVEGQVMVSSHRQATGALVRGLSERSVKSLPLVANSVLTGTFDNFDNQRGIAIGTRLAQSLGVGLNDNITLVSPRGASTPFGTAPRTRAYPIIAIFELGMSEYDRTMVFMPLTEAQKYFSRRGEVDVVEVVTNDPENIDGVKLEIQKAAGNTIQLSDWRQRNETFVNVLDVERNVMFTILSLIILVAALNIISGMIMLVKDKSRDIAILRTMGATRSSMMRVFLIAGASIGILGTIAGAISGIVFCWNIETIRQVVALLTGTKIFDPDVYYLTRLPAKIDATETASIIIMAFALSILATLYPSWRAATLDPVEALRYE